MEEKKVLIVCGEPSGDLQAAALTKALTGLNPHLGVSGVGGAHLSGAGAQVFYDIKDLAVIGFFDVLRKLPRFINLRRLILAEIRRQRPDALILVDFSGFNLRLAKSVPKIIPIIYYISPQVWASRPGRLKTIKKYISRMIVLFKFEEEFYKKAGITVDCVGHPLLDTVRPTAQKEAFLKSIGLSASKTTLALLPGSRKQEIRHILPIMLKACRLVSLALPDTQCIIAKPPQVSRQIYDGIIERFRTQVKIIEDNAYDCLAAADYSLVCSGTATLEAALIQNPFSVIYKMGLLNYLLYRPQVRLPYIGMVNLVAGRRIVPEFIQFQATPKRIADTVIKTLADPLKAERIKNDLREVSLSLGEKGAAVRAARLIIDFLKKNKLG